jgi:AICAR transformylase/IMP cyclohydrolase PurH
LNGDSRIDFDNLPRYDANIDDTFNRLNSMGYHLYSADITLPEIADAGFEVKKVIVPELHPLYLDERAKYLYSKHAGELKEDKSLAPHPFT